MNLIREIQIVPIKEGGVVSQSTDLYRRVGFEDFPTFESIVDFENYDPEDELNLHYMKRSSGRLASTCPGHYHLVYARIFSKQMKKYVT